MCKCWECDGWHFLNSYGGTYTHAPLAARLLLSATHTASEAVEELLSVTTPTHCPCTGRWCHTTAVWLLQLLLTDRSVFWLDSPRWRHMTSQSGRCALSAIDWHGCDVTIFTRLQQAVSDDQSVNNDVIVRDVLPPQRCGSVGARYDSSCIIMSLKHVHPTADEEPRSYKTSNSGHLSDYQ